MKLKPKKVNLGIEYSENKIIVQSGRFEKEQTWSAQLTVGVLNSAQNICVLQERQRNKAKISLLYFDSVVFVWSSCWRTLELITQGSTSFSISVLI